VKSESDYSAMLTEGSRLNSKEDSASLVVELTSTFAAFFYFVTRFRVHELLNLSCLSLNDGLTCGVYSMNLLFILGQPQVYLHVG
jgi:hypothetical protein